MCFSFIIVQQKYTGLTYTSGNSGNWPSHFVRASCSFHKFKLYVKKHRNLLQKKNDAFVGCKEVLYNSLPLLMREKNTGSAYISRSCIFLMHTKEYCMYFEHIISLKHVTTFRISPFSTQIHFLNTLML